MVKEINKSGIISFINKCFAFVNYDNSLSLKDSFLKEIGNEEQYNAFNNELSIVISKLEQDLDFFMASDPAVDSKEEVVAAYPGYKAITYHRIAHILYKLNIRIPARVISEEAHLITGIDIHPGATIGSPFFIDHGTGIVIGETSIIGDRVKIYQGVTLGALSLAKGYQLKGTKRHPTILNDVTIYSGASILGDITIGNNVTIGSNVFLLDSIPDECKVTLNKPELIVTKR